MLKQQLIDTTFFDDCEYLDKYVELITHNTSTAKTPRVTQAHHIIPRSLFQRRNLPVDEQTVNLVFADHVLAHYYLYMCCSDTADKNSNACAVLFMMSRDTMPESEKEIVISREELNKLYTDFQNFMNSPEMRAKMDATHKITCSSEEYKLKMSKIVTEQQRNHPRRWITDGVTERRIEANDPLPEGFRYGRLPVKEDVKDKIRKTVIAHNADEEFRLHQSMKAKEAWERGCYAERDNSGFTPWNKGKTKETCEKLRLAGERRKGQKFSLEARKRLSESRRGILPGNCIKLKCITTGTTYVSMAEAIASTGISAYKIKNSLKDPNYLADGTQWVRIGEINENDNS